jgi:hypothetical protein
MAGKSWMSPVRLVVELRLRNDNHDLLVEDHSLW